jgi:hypothetical protein
MGAAHLLAVPPDRQATPHAGDRRQFKGADEWDHAVGLEP